MQLPPTPKSTPNRNRPPTGRARNGPQKTYASENDVPSYKPENVVSPSTPKKAGSGGAAPRAQSTHQKQKNKGGKNRNSKPNVASPGRRQDRESPPLLPQEISAPIFAGSTFHASPAPSALPLPSFLGLSQADSPPTKAQEPSSLTDSDEGSAAEEPVPRHADSPLEFFFRADRAEKARVRRASSANTDAATPTAFSPPRDPSREECYTFPRAVANNSLRRPVFAKWDSSPSLRTSELEADSRISVGPAFSTPYQERIRAARSNQSPVQPNPTANRNLDLNSSDALKRYLFTGQLGQSRPQEPAHHSDPSLPTIHRGSQQQNTGNGWQRDAFPASHLASFPPSHHIPGSLVGHTPRAQPVSSGQIHYDSSPRSEHIMALEGDLRRMLKLDSRS